MKGLVDDPRSEIVQFKLGYQSNFTRPWWDSFTQYHCSRCNFGKIELAIMLGALERRTCSTQVTTSSLSSLRSDQGRQQVAKGLAVKSSRIEHEGSRVRSIFRQVCLISLRVVPSICAANLNMRFSWSRESWKCRT